MVRWRQARRGGRGRFLAGAAGMGLLTVLAAGLCAAPQLRDVPADHWARPQIEVALARNLMTAPDGAFEPDRPVTRAELAVVLVRLIDAMEKAGPRPFDKSPAKHDVPARQREAARKFPAGHWATPAVRRLVEGGYLSPPEGRPAWMPTPQNLERPATGEEVTTALAAVVYRIQEKKVAVERPEALKEGVRPETREP